MKYEIREQGLGGILDQGIALFRNHFSTLFAVACWLYFPAQLFSNLYSANVEPVTVLPDGTIDWSGMVIQYLLLLLLLVVCTPLTNAAIIHVVAMNYLNKSASIREGVKIAFKNFLPLIWTNIIKGILVGFGMILFIVPGIFLMLVFYFSDHVVVLEKKYGWAALKRSSQLMRNNWGTAFSLGIIIFVITLATTGLFSFVPDAMAQNILLSLMQTALMGLGLAVVVVFYFSARCQHEQFDLQLLASNITEAPADDYVSDDDDLEPATT